MRHFEMRCSKVFGYNLFSEFLITYAPLPSLRDQGRRARGVSRLDKNRNAIYTSSKEQSKVTIAYSHSQSSYFQHAYLSLQANRTGESYKKCTIHRVGCRLTRFEHFLRDIEQAVYRHESAIPKDTTPQPFPWMTEHLIQQFYNNFMNFDEFVEVMEKISDFSNQNNFEAQKVCWNVYYRENHSVLQKLALVNEHPPCVIENLFAIFTQLDKHVSCEISPFLVKKFLVWWIQESETNPDKLLKMIQEWYDSPDAELNTIDFIEFLDLLYKLFFKAFPVSTRNFLLKDAYDSLVGKVLKKGYLAKCGPRNSKFQVRWMILYPDRVEYYKRKSEEEMERRGIIQLGEWASVKNVYDEDSRGHFRFSIVCASSHRKFSIRADDMRIRMAWVTAIDQAIEVLRGGKGLQVFEKPPELTPADHDFLRTSSISRGVVPAYPPANAVEDTVSMPLPYNGAPVGSYSYLDTVDPLILTIPRQRDRDNSKTLHIRNIDRELPYEFSASSDGKLDTDSGCISSSSLDTSIDSRPQNFSSPSSSEEEDVPPVPFRLRDSFECDIDGDSDPVPPPRDKTSQNPPSPSHRTSMTTHPAFQSYVKLVVPPMAPPRERNSKTACPKVPPRKLPKVPIRIDSLRTRH